MFKLQAKTTWRQIKVENKCVREKFIDKVMQQCGFKDTYTYIMI